MKHILYKRNLRKKIKDFSPEEARTYYRLRYESHTPTQRASHRARSKEWYDENPLKGQAAAHNNQVFKAYPHVKDHTDITNESLLVWLESHRGTSCKYCEGPAGHIDHIVPLSKGGPHVFSNLQFICGDCNYAKRDRSEEQFLSWAKRIQTGAELSSS